MDVNAIDLFCGAGGSSYGARDAGITIKAGFDIWKPAIDTFSSNFPTSVPVLGDITELTTTDLEVLKTKFGRIDLILASPECTNHSKAKGNKERSEKSKNTAFEVIKFASVFKPKWIIIENVVEMQSWSKHEEFLNKLWDLDYFVKEIRLNSKNFAVPQSRERLFILCSLTGKAHEPVADNTEVAISSVLDFSGKYKTSPLFTNNRAEKTVLSAKDAISKIGPDKPFLLVYYGSARKENKGWTTIDKPIGTLTTLDRYALVQPSNKGHEMRMLQPEELKLAMGFRKDFNLTNIQGINRRDRIKLIGNGVSPPVMKSVIESLVLH